MSKKVLVLLIVLTLFLVGCNKEPSLIEQAKIQEAARLADEAKNNKTTEPVEPKEIIPSEFLESCKYNQQIEFFILREEKEMCINSEGQLVVNIQGSGFDPISSIKLVLGTKEYISEEKDLGYGKMRIYRFDDVILEGIKTIQVIPRGKFFDGKVYDCKASKITHDVSKIKECIN